MTTKKKPASDPLVAAETILIEGKAFERGERITGVSKDQIDIAAVQRRVIKKSAFDALGVPAPEFVSEEPEGDEPEGDKPEGDKPEGDGGDTGGSSE